ncbi:hypothetical protein VOLCADRAFT_98321 [Volvox carteri f. nagariensis]|uniref:Uncharacterized protein n=1 Tax=Volvox carteri f. nagariensis TaxID=3068 RepID=D8UEX3_VOLCA|nr:uncharacterized protein VOLCADRAFT_98321 [Volvox carteri f. nagariensis]EFJ41716.1 hypothetical protein VOLCADRAFT_98321 [Volvox carteri f. nagariensis]|eukprot:XP_002957218.1 hypothetical protein VOLCADRAFT_98321 [Volvox carteri f. nagariensis]
MAPMWAHSLLCSSSIIQNFLILRPRVLLETPYKLVLCFYHSAITPSRLSEAGFNVVFSDWNSSSTPKLPTHSCSHGLSGYLGGTVRLFHAPWAHPADEWESRRIKQVQRSQAAALQNIRNCCTFEELLKVLPPKGSAPELVIQAALQATRVLEWPLSASDRRLLYDLLEHLSQQCAIPLSRSEPHYRHRIPILRNVEEYDISQLATFLGVCARARYTPGELLVPLQHRLMAEIREQRLKNAAAAVNVAALVRHLSLLRAGGRQLWNAAVAAAEASMRHASTADVARMLVAFGRVNVLSKLLVNRAMSSALPTMKLAAPQVKWGTGDGRGPAHALSSSGQLAVNLSLRGPDYDLISLGELASACSDMGLGSRHKNLYDLMSQLGAKAMHRQTAMLEASLLPSGVVTTAGVRIFDSFSGGGGGVMRAPLSQPVGPQTLLTLVASLSRVQPPSRHQPTLLRAASALLVAWVRRAAARVEDVEGADLARLDELAVVLGAAGLEEERRELLHLVGAGAGLGGIRTVARSRHGKIRGTSKTSPLSMVMAQGTGDAGPFEQVEWFGSAPDGMHQADELPYLRGSRGFSSRTQITEWRFCRGWKLMRNSAESVNTLAASFPSQGDRIRSCQQVWTIRWIWYDLPMALILKGYEAGVFTKGFT